MDKTEIPIDWTARTVPLAPLGVVALGLTSGSLVRHLLTLDDASLLALSGLGDANLVVVLGDTAALPWVDGVFYLGRDEAAPSLRLPTTLAPSIPVTLLERAVLAHFPAVPPPVALLPAQTQALSLAGARPLDRTYLETWLKRYL